MPRRGRVGPGFLLILIGVIVVAAYLYTQSVSGFTDASGNSGSISWNSLATWQKALIIIVILGAVGLSIWAFILQTKSVATAASGFGEGFRNIGAGVKSGLSGWGNKQRANAGR